MSAEPKKDTLAGATKKDIALSVTIAFLGLFIALIIILMFKADYTVTISGSLDVNLIWATFIGIIMSVMSFLGFKAAQSLNGKT